MQRRSKRHRKTSGTDSKKRTPTPHGFAAWLASTSRPGADLSLLLAKVRAAQIRRTHFR
jgi:hypothetical protein